MEGLRYHIQRLASIPAMAFCPPAIPDRAIVPKIIHPDSGSFPQSSPSLQQLPGERIVLRFAQAKQD
jgi:hypothetical protein